MLSLFLEAYRAFGSGQLQYPLLTVLHSTGGNAITLHGTHGLPSAGVLERQIMEWRRRLPQYATYNENITSSTYYWDNRSVVLFLRSELSLASRIPRRTDPVVFAMSDAIARPCSDIIGYTIPRQCDTRRATMPLPAPQAGRLPSILMPRPMSARHARHTLLL